MAWAVILLAIDERGSKSLETVFSIAICRQFWRQMAIENSVSNDFCTFVDSINVFECRLSGV